VFDAFIHCFMGSAPIGVQCSLTSTLGELPGYWDWLSFSPMLVSKLSIAFPYLSIFHSLYCTCHWISFVFILYDWLSAPIGSAVPSLAHFLGEFPGLGLALVQIQQIKFITRARSHQNVNLRRGKCESEARMLWCQRRSRSKHEAEIITIIDA